MFHVNDGITLMCKIDQTCRVMDTINAESASHHNPNVMFYDLGSVTLHFSKASDCRQRRECLAEIPL